MPDRECIVKHSFTFESEGYDRYLFRRALLPKLGWAAGAAGLVFTVLSFIR
jgi:hypothetical protein